MSTTAQASSASADWRSVIHAFIRERRDAKLNGSDPSSAPEVAAKYEPLVWLEDAARRSAQIKMVSHVLKATHPDAKGASLHVLPGNLPQHDAVGTHSLAGPQPDDVVGNAAALDVYKLLKLEHAGQRLLDALTHGDAQALKALHPDAALAGEWADAFTSLLKPAEGRLASHTFAKQVYWCVEGDPVDDASYHLLQPLFSSVLDHVVHAEIQQARFGESNGLARKAWREKLAHEVEYRDYRGLVARKLGGTKPQNISQLNSERRGVNYLLASLPPQWDVSKRQSLRGLDSIMQRFEWFEGVNELVAELTTLLKNAPAPNMAVRDERTRIEQDLADAFAAFGEDFSASLEPGWSRDKDCSLPLCEQIWLDPERAALADREGLEGGEDASFRTALEWKDWPDEVATQFANWLNQALAKEGLPVGVTEAKHWAKQVVVEAEWPATVRRRLMATDNVEVHDE